MAAHQAPPSLGFSRQEHWSGLPFPSPICMKVKSESEVAQSCPTLSDPEDCSLPGSSIHGIFQARVLEWGAIAFSGNYGWKLPKPKKEPDIHEQEAQRVPNKMNPKRSTARHIIIKMAKFRSNSKGTKRKRVTYKGPPIRLSVDFSEKLCRTEGNGMIF